MDAERGGGLRLHIGPGINYLPGRENVDIFNNIKADLYSSALTLPYPRETFEIVYASHILEHCNRHIIWHILIRTSRYLKYLVMSVIQLMRPLEFRMGNYAL